MAPAKYLISDNGVGRDISNNDLFTFSNHLAINRTSIMSCTRPTPTKSLHLQGLNAIGKFN
jgi:hypothetical protein